MGGKFIPEAQPVTHTNIHTIEQNLRSALPPGLPCINIGSAGKKETASDLDVLIDEDNLTFLSVATSLPAKQFLAQHLSAQGLQTKKSGISVHVGIPNGIGISQVDIMIVKNAVEIAALHCHDYSKDNNMSGGILHGIWADLLKLSRPDLKISPYRGLVNRATDELLSTSKDRIARVIIDTDASAIDISSYSAILSALSKYPDKQQFIIEKYFKNET